MIEGNIGRDILYSGVDTCFAEESSQGGIVLEAAEQALLQMMDKYLNNSDVCIQMAFLTAERASGKEDEQAGEGGCGERTGSYGQAA